MRSIFAKRTSSVTKVKSLLPLRFLRLTFADISGPFLASSFSKCSVAVTCVKERVVGREKNRSGWG